MDERNRQGDDVREAVVRFFDERGLMHPGAGMVVGVSGGCDSVGLLAAMVEISRDRGRKWSLRVAHLHHGLRDDADADAEFVAELSRKWDVPCTIEHHDIPTESTQSARGLEETARDVRYAFLRDLAVRTESVCVAVAHHADDNVETVLHHILRGTHLRGAVGIPPVRKLPDSDVLLVRPLLQCTRDQIEEFVRSLRLHWRTDRSNTDVRYRRNFIRHQLLPMLRQGVNPKVDEAILRFASAVREVEEYLLDQGRALLGEAERHSGATSLSLDLKTMTPAPPIVRKVAMRLALEELGLPLQGMSMERFDELSALCEPDGRPAVTLPGNFVARKQRDEILIAPLEQSPSSESESITLQVPGSTDLGDARTIACEFAPLDPPSFTEHCCSHRPGIELLDADALQGPLVWRTRKDGDKFHPLGCPGTQSVSDFLTNMKLRKPDRARVRCMCDDGGIVYLVPLRIDERVKVTPQTKRVLRVTARGFDL